MVMTDGTVYRFITDHLGSVRLVVNAATGEVAQRMDYDAFGRVLQNTAPGFQPFGFAGGLYDDDTGLVRFGARDYDAYSGRWTAKDPILFFAGSASLYRYVDNDPVNRIDPSGLTILEFDRGQGRLNVYDDNANLMFSTSGSTGEGHFMNNPMFSEGENGPIPGGVFTIDPTELSDPSFLWDIGRNFASDWGDWRVPLHPATPMPPGRGGFFLHGGTQPGTIGCIDIGGGVFGDSTTDAVKDAILADDDGLVPLYVR